jgi:acetyl-CoA carboxylase/biotin carboxylase 1
MVEQNGQGVANGPRNGVVVPRANGQASYAEKHSLPSHFIGGNRLDNAPASKVKEFVARHDGHTVITNVSPPPARP